MLGRTLLIVDDELHFRNTIAGDFTAELRLAPLSPKSIKSESGEV